MALEATPSMRATLKYFWVVAALIVVQVGLGAVGLGWFVLGLKTGWSLERPRG